MEVVVEPLARDPQPQRPAGRRRCGLPGDDPVDERHVGHGGREHPGGVPRARDGHGAAAAPPAGGGAPAHHPAVRRRHPQRAAGVGAQREGDDAGRDGDRRPAGGAPGRAGRVVRVAHRPEGGVVAGDAERQLVQVGLADHGGPGSAQPGHRVLVTARPGVAERRRPAGGGQLEGVQVVLDRERDAGERTRPRPGVVGDRDEGAEVGGAVGRLDARGDHRLRRGRGDPLAHLVDSGGLHGQHRGTAQPVSPSSSGRRSTPAGCRRGRRAGRSRR